MYPCSQFSFSPQFIKISFFTDSCCHAHQFHANCFILYPHFSYFLIKLFCLVYIWGHTLGKLKPSHVKFWDITLMISFFYLWMHLFISISYLCFLKIRMSNHFIFRSHTYSTCAFSFFVLINKKLQQSPLYILFSKYNNSLHQFMSLIQIKFFKKGLFEGFMEI